MKVQDVRQLIGAELSELHTCLPGKIVTYDGKFATVKPSLDKQLANGQTLAAPQIVKVPVCWLAGVAGSAQITVPLKPGDDVLLHFSERALENWLGGSDQAPDDPRVFDLSDAFASPMLRPTVGKADTTNVNIQYGPTTIKITPSGDVLVSGPGTMIVDMLSVFKKLATFQAGQVIQGNVAHSGGVITSSGPIQDAHHHKDAENRDTSGPLP